MFYRIEFDELILSMFLFSSKNLEVFPIRWHSNNHNKGFCNHLVEIQCFLLFYNSPHSTFQQVTTSLLYLAMPQSVFSIVAQLWLEWLNIVFNLKEVLCQCMSMSTIKGVKVHKVQDNVFFDQESTLLGTKAIYICKNF